MESYLEFLERKKQVVRVSGFDISQDQLNPILFDFQKAIVQKALNRGRYAVFADCGMGKTLMQLEFVKQASIHTQSKALIVCPLAVAAQTISEGQKFGYDVALATGKLESKDRIYITNYEQLENVDCAQFDVVCIDESSILKNFTGVYKNLIIELFKNAQFKLACTATPAPNDLNEIGNHSQFLDIMDASDMRMRWFVRDEGMNNYRLKRHAYAEFYGWIGSWASVLRKPSDIGDFSDDGYVLPNLNLIERQIVTEKKDNGKLFNDDAVNATNFNSELRLTKVERMTEVAEIVNNSTENFIIWIKQNEEGDLIRSLIPDAVEVKGSDSQELKEKRLLGFAKNEFRVLVTKTKIAQFGLNYQNCSNQIFASLDFSFEGLYQAIRRSYRFGQANQVNIYILTTDTMQNVINSIKRKEVDFNTMMDNTVHYANSKEFKLKMDYTRNEAKTDDYTLINGDCVDLIKELDDNSIDFSVFSPPFSTLFTYSDNLRDMGNCASHEEFYVNYQFLLSELYRVIKNGRLVAVHTKDLACYKNSDGFSGLYDFTGRLHRLMEDVGFKYHSKVTIWTDPVLEMQRTKTQRLLYKQVTSDSTYTGIGLPEYVTIFRKWDGLEEDWQPVTNLNKQNFPLDTWQRWASPVWMDIQRTDVLTKWRDARNINDEKHICPLQIGVIERCIALWSNEGETVLTPFAGIGSEVYQAVKMGRKGIGFELKEDYFKQAVKNLESLTEIKRQQDLFT